jgi:hypothetical protein
MEVLSALFEPQDGARRERRTFTQSASSVKVVANGMFTRQVLKFSVAHRGGIGLKAMHSNIGVEQVEPGIPQSR